MTLFQVCSSQNSSWQAQEGSVMGKLNNVTDLIKKQINISFNDFLDTCEARSFKLTRLSNFFEAMST